MYSVNGCMTFYRSSHYVSYKARSAYNDLHALIIIFMVTINADNVINIVTNFNVVVYQYYHNCYGTARRAYSITMSFYLIHGDATMHKFSLQLGVVHVSYIHIPTVVYWII